MLEILIGAVVLIVVVLGAGIAFAVLRASSSDATSSGPWPFSLRRPLTEPEQVLYFRLRQALPDHMVLAQVGMSRFLAVRRGHNARAWYNRINRMNVDFLVCNKDASVVAAIELDEASQQQPDRANTDAKKELALKAAGVRLVRWKVSAMPDEAAIQMSIATAATTPGKRASRAESPDTGSFRTA
jgi:very-short-patch-repair endonuclease